VRIQLVWWLAIGLLGQPGLRWLFQAIADEPVNFASVV